MTTRSDAPKIKLYLFLLAIQITGVVAFVHEELPEIQAARRPSGRATST
jgi:hypothetical protein